MASLGVVLLGLALTTERVHDTLKLSLLKGLDGSVKPCFDEITMQTSEVKL